VDALSPSFAALLADAVLALHVGIVAFVVFGQLAILIGAWRRWRWIRNFPFRASHLALLAFIALQAWLGRLCPLTLWEQALRARAGQSTYAGSFVEHCLSRLIFFDAPWWTFVAAYTAFAALAIACWRWAPPSRTPGGA